MTKTVSMKEAKDRLTALARLVEKGETVTVTRNGKPVLDLVPHRPRRGGINFEGGRKYMKDHGIERFFDFVAEDFDAPLAEDFLLQPLPPDPEKK
jgi:prevent-host-death family protein